MNIVYSSDFGDIEIGNEHKRRQAECLSRYSIVLERFFEEKDLPKEHTTSTKEISQCIPSIVSTYVPNIGPFSFFFLVFTVELPPQHPPCPLKCFTLPRIAIKKTTISTTMIISFSKLF